MDLLRDAVIKDNIFHFIADIPAYACIAYINLTQVYLPKDYDYWEQFLLKHGWLILLSARFFIALYDIWVRMNNKGEYIDENGKPQKNSVWSVIMKIFKSFIR